MRAIVYHGNGRYELEEVPTPEPGVGEALVRVEANTVCGTDLRIMTGVKSRGVKPPVILGHEVAGSVVEVGRGVDGIAVGDRVGVTPSLPCHACRECQLGRYNLCPNVRILGHDIDGGLADYFLAPAGLISSGGVARVDADVSAEEVALAEPLSCVLHAHALLETGVQDVVVVVGGGPIGQMHAQVARVLGAREVILSEPVATRRELALRLGADAVVDPADGGLVEAVADLTDRAGAQVVVVCAGVPGLAQEALAVAAKRARVSLFAGFPSGEMSSIDPNAIHYGEISLIGSSNSTAAEYRVALDLIARRRVDVGSLVSDRFGLEGIAAALVRASAPTAMKVAILPLSEGEDATGSTYQAP